MARNGLHCLLAMAFLDCAHGLIVGRPALQHWGHLSFRARWRGLIAAGRQDEAHDRSDGFSSNEDVRWRPLGSYEKLLTRKAATGPPRLSIPHVCVALVTGGPFDGLALTRALLPVIRRHPLLRARIVGTGHIEGAPVAGVRIGGVEPDPLSWAPCDLTEDQVAQRAVEVEVVEDKGLWQKVFQSALDETDFDLSVGPMWRLRALVAKGESSAALVFTFNHAISDQISTNNIIHELLTSLADNLNGRNAVKVDMSGTGLTPSSEPPVPTSVETAVIGNETFGLNTGRYLFRQAVLGALPITLLPEDCTAAVGLPAHARRTICEFRRLERAQVEVLLEACRKRGLTVTAALAAAMLLTVSDFTHDPADHSRQLYKFLLSLNMRAFAAPGSGSLLEGYNEAVSCAAGAMDFTAKLYANSGPRQKTDSEGREQVLSEFWRLASDSRQEYLRFVDKGYARESVLLFDLGMRSVEINDVVEKEADNARTLGRAFTCGVSNMGVYRPQGSVQYGPYRLEGIHYATSHSLTGSLYQLSCGTVGGELFLTLHYPWPVITRQTAAAFADALMALLEDVVRSERRADAPLVE